MTGRFLWNFKFVWMLWDWNGFDLMLFYKIRIHSLFFGIDLFKGLKCYKNGIMKSLRGKPRIIMFLGLNLLLSQQAAENLTWERLNG
jgi:hypothetical protein